MKSLGVGHKIAVLGFICSYCVLVASASFQRKWLNFLVETDFLSRFLPEAERVVANNPLLLDFHPPLYSMALAGTFSLVPDRMAAALCISLAAAAVALASTWVFISYSLNERAGWAAMFGLAVSPNFLMHAGSATSDAFFVGLYLLTLAWVAAACVRDSAACWLGAGLVGGAVLLTRSNGIVLLSLMAIPLLLPGTAFKRLRCWTVFVSGIGLTIGCWLLYARVSGSPLAPSGNHLSIATTYFPAGGKRIGADARLAIEGQFGSIADVLMHDPVRLIRTYIYDLLRPKYLADWELLPPPIAFAGLFGALYMIYRKSGSRLWWIFVSVAILHVLLINLKPYQPRYFIFVVPMLFASACAALGLAIERRERTWTLVRTLGVVSAICAVVAYSIYSYRFAVKRFHLNDDELASAVAHIGPLLAGQNRVVILSRKPHVPHYLNVGWRFLPHFDSVEALISELENQPTGIQSYIYYGSIEHRTRPQYVELDALDDSFSKALQGGDDPGWSLYRFDRKSR